MRALLAALGVFVVFLVLDACFPFPFARLTRPSATLITARDGTPLRVVLPADGICRIPVTLDEVPGELPAAFIASEDRYFRLHPGVNPLAIGRAALSNLREGRRVSGGSTLTMQVARLASPRKRTLGSKAIEAFRALQLEWHWSKDEILTAYLNLTPYGGNLEGVGSAAWFHFGKRPQELSLGEIALLVTLPRAPNTYDPAKHPDTARAARDRVLAQLEARGGFNAMRIAEARRQDVPRARVAAPFLAPHLCDLALATAGRVPRIGTTVDPAQQAAVERLVAAHARSLRAGGIRQAAAVVLDLETGEVRAVAGSAGFFEQGYSGQVNGAAARRSPGSTLKPFLYALAFEKGIATPDTLVTDLPADYGGYVAENYDGVYHGPVPVREALVNSLNACAVRLTAQTGLADYLEELRRFGFVTLDRPASEYGLPLVLGSGEVRLLDLAGAYGVFGRGGAGLPVRYLQGEPVAGTRLLSAESCAWITDVLSGLKRPDLEGAYDLTVDAPAVAWKTGTSYGHRDAWAVGYSRRHVIAVWCGNFEGGGVLGLSGATHAAPLLFRLFRTLEHDGAQLPRFATRVSHASVCRVSRGLPTPACRDLMDVEVAPRLTRLAPCALHQRAFIDDATGERLSAGCLAQRAWHEDVLTVWPPEVARFYTSHGVPLQELPRWRESCGAIPAGKPRVVSPSAATPYRLRSGVPPERQRIPLTAHTESPQLWWYVDGALRATGAPTETLMIDPSPGKHRLVVVDAEGRSDALTYVVEE